MRNLDKHNHRGYKMDHFANVLDAIQIESKMSKLEQQLQEEDSVTPWDFWYSKKFDTGSKLKSS